MTREKRKMVRILDLELFETNKKAIAHFEGENGRATGGNPTQTLFIRQPTAGHHVPHLCEPLGRRGRLTPRQPTRNACNG